MKTADWLRHFIDMANDFEPVAIVPTVNQPEKGNSMYRPQWVIAHHDTFGQRPPRYYDREACKLVDAVPTTKHIFNNRVDAERIRDEVAGQLHGGLLKIELVI